MAAELGDGTAMSRVRESRPRMGRATKLAITAGAGILLIAGGLLAFNALVLHLGGNVPSGVACADLPSLSDVERVLDENRDLVREIERLGPGTIRIYAAQPCDGEESDRGEVLIEVASNAERDQVLEILRKTSFRVPVSIVNV